MTTQHVHAPYPITTQTTPPLTVARFFVYFDSAFCLVELHPGESRLLETGMRSTAEGWDSEGMQLTFDGETVTRICVSDGIDCDGRLRHVSEETCHKDRLATHSCLDGLCFTPEWVLAESHQVDEEAERAGY